jgi:hypothetical protein
MTNGGPAFPVFKHYDNGHMAQVSEGMALRDWFAGMALQGMAPHIDDEVKAARWCEMADAMLKERLK